MDRKANAGDEVTLTLGGGVGTVFKTGGRTVNGRAEGPVNVIEPDAGPGWTIRATLQLLIAK